MLSRFLTRAAPPVVALSVIALVPTLALLGRLGLLTDPMVLASFVLVIGFLTVGLVTTVRRVGNPIGWLLLWQGVVAGFSLLGAAYGMYDLQVAAEPLPGGSLLLWTATWIWLAALAVSPVIHVLFPDGRLLSRRWAGVIWLALASMALAMAAIAVAAWPLPGPALLEGPSWGPELDPPPSLALLGLAMFDVAEAVSLTAMAIRLRRGQGRRARADQVVPLRRQLRDPGHHPGNRPWCPDHHRVMARRNGGSLRDRGRALQVSPLRHRPAHQPNPGLRAPHRPPRVDLRRCRAGLGVVFGGVAKHPRGWTVAVVTLAVASLFQPARRRSQTVVDLTVAPTSASLWLRPAAPPSAPSQG